MESRTTTEDSPTLLSRPTGHGALQHDQLGGVSDRAVAGFVCFSHKTVHSKRVRHISCLAYMFIIIFSSY